MMESEVSVLTVPCCTEAMNLIKTRLHFLFIKLCRGKKKQNKKETEVCFEVRQIAYTKTGEFIILDVRFYDYEDKKNRKFNKTLNNL